MPLLDDTGAIADRFLRPAEGALVATDTAVIVPLARLEAEAASDRARARLGVEITPDARIDALRPWLDRVSLIAISFKSFTDGRGFSLARQLRLAGFTGELRAVGALIADQFAFLRSVGFDTVEIDEASAGRQPVEQWTAALNAFSGAYQRSYGAPLNILAARREGRSNQRAAAE